MNMDFSNRDIENLIDLLDFRYSSYKLGYVPGNKLLHCEFEKNRLVTFPPGSSIDSCERILNDSDSDYNLKLQEYYAQRHTVDAVNGKLFMFENYRAIFGKDYFFKQKFMGDL